MINNNLRKYSILIFSLMISFGVFGAIKGKKDKVLFIEIYSVNMMMETQFAVYCDQFWKVFKGEVKKSIIKDKFQIDRVVRGLKDSHKISMAKIEARSKLYIHYYSGKTDSACLTRTEELLYNDSYLMLNSKDIIFLVDSLYYSAK